MSFHPCQEPELEIVTVTLRNPGNCVPLKLAKVIENIAELSGVRRDRIRITMGRDDRLSKIEIFAPRFSHDLLRTRIIDKKMEDGLHRIVAYY